MVKTTVTEKFDEAGNLTERVTVTEDSTKDGYVSPTYPQGIRVGDVWPYGYGRTTVPNTAQYVSINGDMVSRDKVAGLPNGEFAPGLRGVL